MKITRKSAGLGDTIDKITTATGIKSVVSFVTGSDKPCSACEERRKKLNAEFPYKNGDTKTTTIEGDSGNTV